MPKVLKSLGDPSRPAIFELVRDCDKDGCSEDQAADSLSQIAVLTAAVRRDRRSASSSGAPVSGAAS